MGTSESTYGIPEENMLSFLPDFIFQTITQIRPAFLREHGIRLLLMDFDNTMLPYTTDRPEQPLLDWIAGMQDAGITLCIVSNSHKQRVPHFSQQYHVPCVTHAAKPGTRGIREAMERYGVPHQDYYKWCGPNAGGYVLDAKDWTQKHILTVIKTVQYTKSAAEENP